jgi:hypothetical protein
MTIWYILCSFGTLFPVLVSRTKKNLATLTHTAQKGALNCRGKIFLMAGHEKDAAEKTQLQV